MTYRTLGIIIQFCFCCLNSGNTIPQQVGFISWLWSSDFISRAIHLRFMVDIVMLGEGFFFFFLVCAATHHFTGSVALDTIFIVTFLLKMSQRMYAVHTYIGAEFMIFCYHSFSWWWIRLIIVSYYRDPSLHPIAVNVGFIVDKMAQIWVVSFMPRLVYTPVPTKKPGKTG